MIKKNIIAAALLATGFAMSASASAQAYVGGTVGQAKWNADCQGTTQCDTSDTAFKLLGGLDLYPNIAVEASYFSLGKATANVSGIKAEFKASGVDLVGVFKTTPVNGFVGFAKLGVGYIKGETSVSVGSLAGSTSKNSAQAVAGLGVTYQLTNNVSLRAEYERRDAKVADVDGAKVTISNFSVGAQYAF
ncbi:outer membrane beta-barrel protein [Undibacterium sp. CY21W]|jgi:OOP family OmpA-OmpF porin|uniref:outer membrane beta-barrel protein n=1 Tax=Undibacterium sp. CY21W TaxID=2762293 RepID=UPI00164B7F4B|nr:outer membrane beta-barrel protein [Undibacterium sp. CY21W]MBC3929429.1 outer membrane beta-barrel protein [Undibacterium sp. CY21W]